MRSYRLLQLLANGKFYSGQELGRQLEMSRTAVWNHIRHLRELGLDIFAVQGKGYRLADPLELLDKDSILQSVTPQHKTLQLDVFPELDSTNRYLMQRIYESPQHSVRVCIADYQTDGRGRRGRQWVSPFGSNLYFSMLWRVAGGVAAIEGMSLVVALALIEALESMGIEGAGVKWPNDIYFDQRKLAGILLEMSGEASGACHVVIGVGINVNMSRYNKPEIDQPWTDLAQICGDTVSRNRLAAEMINALTNNLSTFEREGFAAFRERWQRYDLLAGKAINVHEMQGVRQGVAMGIDHSGALLVDAGQGTERVLSGDVSIRLSDGQD